jgi:hypothetical protein
MTKEELQAKFKEQFKNQKGITLEELKARCKAILEKQKEENEKK